MVRTGRCGYSEGTLICFLNPVASISPRLVGRRSKRENSKKLELRDNWLTLASIFGA